jgi:glutamyl-tRNA reductase
MNWAMLGWSHHGTPIQIRERLAFSDQQVHQALEQFRDQYSEVECVLLSTCNRVELYCASEQTRLPSHQQLVDFVARFHDIDPGQLDETAVRLSGTDVIGHLFKVASSLDSMVIGEAQILSQVRSAYEMACECQTALTQMHRAFQRATAVARRIANETSINRRRISVPSVAVSEIATEFFERFDDKQILLVGAGEMSLETLRYLQDAGARKMSVINRSFSRAEQLAKEHSLQAEPWELLDLYIADADLIVSTTGSPDPIVTLDRFQKIRDNKNHAVLILDLAVPRDFEPSIADYPDTYLYSVDDLQQVCQRNIQARQAEMPKAMQLVEQETIKFVSESRHATSGSTIRKLREQAEAVKRDELKRLMDKLRASDLDPEVQQEISYAFDRLVNKMLHPPLKSLRDNADSTHHASLLDALRRLFQIND